MTSRGEASEPKDIDPEENYEVQEGTPTFFCDQIHFNTGVWGATLYLGEVRPGRKPLLQARVKMSPQMLRAISILSTKHVRTYEQDIGPISLPNQLVHDWGVEEEMR